MVYLYSTESGAPLTYLQNHDGCLSCKWCTIKQGSRGICIVQMCFPAFHRVPCIGISNLLPSTVLNVRSSNNKRVPSIALTDTKKKSVYGKPFMRLALVDVDHV